MADARSRGIDRFRLKFFFATYLILLAFAVFTPVDSGGSSWIGLIGANPLWEKLINLGLLAPLSVFIYRMGARLTNIQNAIVIFVFSGTIETIQLFIPGRVSDPLDVALNLVGGISAHRWAKRLFVSPDR